MKELLVELITPQGKLFGEKATSVTLPGVEGQFQVLHNHAALVSALGVGIVKIKTGTGESRYNIDGGIVEVYANTVSIMAERASEA